MVYNLHEHQATCGPEERSRYSDWLRDGPTLKYE